MKHLLLTTIAAVVLVGCGESQPPEPPDVSIHEAAGSGNIYAVKQHLAAGTDVNAPEYGGLLPYNGETPLDVDEKVYRETPLDVDEKVYRGRVPLHNAARGGHKEVIELLIANGADVNAKDIDGETPLRYAAAFGRKEIVELLITKGADVNTKVGNGSTHLHAVAYLDYKEIAELLIAGGADVNAKDVDGETPLDWAVENGNSEIITLLRKHGGKTGEELKAEGK